MERNEIPYSHSALPALDSDVEEFLRYRREVIESRGTNVVESTRIDDFDDPHMTYSTEFTFPWQEQNGGFQDDDSGGNYDHSIVDQQVKKKIT